MLDTATKKRIDDCRDILVGKLPDPKAQIEQITIGLIYKFMDDMDKEAIELGGKAKFFTGEYKKYSWDNLMNARVTAAELLRLYSEAIQSMDKNKNIPQLFRDIFKNAFLPYRDPETLKLFLRTIGEFEYTHSEMLGDAFEYLLSVMGSQGDAGQFRTPRHIIDFLVAIVDPQKDDTILDPACGTAGFLISAFKHIKEKNNQTLTPAERKRLIQNFIGYDISPDMVRLSLVNLYLHGFSDPHIYEYDTLSSEERWKDNFDVILANPPFMSPKGGIRPHKKFSIDSSRSEVLFVDYIAEHLNPGGKAGIIVPEGIIFQSGTAYKALRKMLVENYLSAVVSLPAGIFNPYSGVKTSILLLDREVAKRSKEVLFVKIDNDGFNLGSQRNAIKGGQLSEAIKIIHNFNSKGKHPAPGLAHAVRKTEIAKSGDYNLSGERYKTINAVSNKFPSVKLGDVCKVLNGRAYKQEELLDKGKYPVLRVGNFFSNRGWYYSDLELDPEKYCNNGDLLYAWSASFGPKIWGGGKSIYHYHIWKMITDESRVNKQFLYHVLNRETESIKAEGGRGIAMIHITKSGIEQREFPLPPLSFQEEIVTEIEGYQKIIDGAKMVVENYQPKIEIDSEWAMVKLDDICELNPKKSELENQSTDLQVSFVPMADMKENSIYFDPLQIKPLEEVIKGYTYFRNGDVLLAKVTPCFENGKAGVAKNLINGIGFGSSEYYVLRPKENVLPEWVYYFVTTNQFRINGKLNMTGTGGLQRVPKEFVANTLLPLPSLDIQKHITSEIRKTLAAVNSNLQLIEIFNQKIKDKIASVWSNQMK